MKLKIGTRGSKLALWQTQYVAEKLRAGGVESEVVVINTRGDKRQDVAITEIGTRGVFTEEIEEQLQRKTIDLAVHSAKDLQSSLPEAFEIAAFTEREQTADVLVSHQPNFSLHSNQPLTIGTSSVRRKALLKHYNPHLNTVEMRGNLQTRMAKMEAGQCDALMLAYAGVHRMEYDRSIVHQFSTEQMIPAVGQGSVAVEVLASLSSEKKKVIRELINHEITEQQLRAERAYLKALRGGCSVPVFALATITDNRLLLRGGVVSLDGRTLLKDQATGSKELPEEVGEILAEKIISQGGNQILELARK
ncbi:hydroxymethylbilane synthase [Tunicatimonas pelagia]|uniref:hydroxymethylbilane synthase n=1 Tax=Tunicatimonas pelagia TaxID=931531 RepID=UPI002666FBC8|nr:hydroxymethylbilane synthase [Tunicatimonas pelagia]WKN44709.1 hydroxymethylbilane synthase [Tunicatimonas pelagia]